MSAQSPEHVSDSLSFTCSDLLNLKLMGWIPVSSVPKGISWCQPLLHLP